MDETQIEDIVEEVLDELDAHLAPAICPTEDAIEILESLAGRCQAMADALKEQNGG